METASPAKRRALAPLDANAMSSPKTDHKTSSNLLATSAKISPFKDLVSGKKRSTVSEASDSSPASKKTCLERDEDEPSTRSRSQSPDNSSVFDTSAGDASWATAATEPELAVEAAPVVTRPRALTREQVREKAEILRLRLGLASYKVRTGQTTVPLADLQLKPLPRRIGSTSPVRRHTVSANMTSLRETVNTKSGEETLPASRPASSSAKSSELFQHKPILPPPRETAAAAVPPQRDSTDTEDVVPVTGGGSASGSMSLSQGETTEEAS